MDIQFSSEVALPTLIKAQVLKQASRFSGRHKDQFRNSVLEMHYKFEGPQVECKLDFITNQGKYYATVLGWDVRQITHDAIERLDTQVQKHLEKRNDMEGYDRRNVASEVLG